MAKIIRIWDQDKKEYVDFPTLIGKKGDAGPRGYSGVFYGSEAPNNDDGSHPVWINPDGDLFNNNAKIVTTLEYKNIVVPVEDFISDDTYSEQKYLFRANVSLEYCDESLTPYIVPSMKDIVSGNLAPIAVPNNEGVYIYAKKMPTEDVILETINLLRGNQ